MTRFSILDLIPTALLVVPLACAAETSDDPDYEFIEAYEDVSIEPAFAPTPLDDRSPVLRLLLTDAPADVDAVFVTIEQALAYVCSGEGAEQAPGGEPCEEGEWVTVVDEPVTFELLTLQGGATVEMGAAELAAGTYGQVRLELGKAQFVLRGEEYPLEVSTSVVSTGTGFSLETGKETRITLDFDAEASLFWSGQTYLLRPAVSVVSTTTAPL